VERVGLLVGRQNLVSDDTAANTDARVVELIVRLDPESSTRAAGLSNLEAVARIAWRAPRMTRLLQRLLGRLPVGWLQLTHSRGRLAAAIAGVAFANVLVLVQLGIAGALNGTIVQGYDLLPRRHHDLGPDGTTMTDGGNVARQHLWRRWPTLR
jgi:hypothetical protein